MALGDTSELDLTDETVSVAEGALWNAQLAHTTDRPWFGDGAVFGEEFSAHLSSGGGVHNGYLLRRLLVASIEGGQIQDKQTVEAENMTCSQLPGFLASLGVSKMICGGIERPVQQEIESRGIEVIWGVIGPAAEALWALVKGTLHENQFVRRRD